MIDQRHRETDGQTDGQTTCDRKTALCTIVHRVVHRAVIMYTTRAHSAQQLLGSQGHHSPANTKPPLTMPNKHGRHKSLPATFFLGRDWAGGRWHQKNLLLLWLDVVNLQYLIHACGWHAWECESISLRMGVELFSQWHSRFHHHVISSSQFLPTACLVGVFPLHLLNKLGLTFELELVCM